MDYLPIWLKDLLTNQSSIAYTVIVFAVVISVGVWLGRIKIFGVSFGIACVLFMGILLSHFGFTVDHTIMHFIKEFGLILFVYTIGLQVGPGFFASFQEGGLKLNILVILSVLSCGLTVILIKYTTGANSSALVGIMSGAVTNTPGLGAAQQTIIDVFTQSGNKEGIDAAIADMGNGYAVAYPFGVLGLIIMMLVSRFLFKVNIESEKELDVNSNKSKNNLVKSALKIENPVIFDKSIDTISKILDIPFVISRLRREGKVTLVDKNTMLKEGDEILIVANSKHFEKLSVLIGNKTDLSLFELEATDIVSRRLNVTNKMAYSRKLNDIISKEKIGVTISRIFRSGVEFVPTDDTKLQFGDTIVVVGEEEHISEVEKVFGNSKKELEHPHIAELFLGITLGVILGSLPIPIPGLSMPVKLGLAGGPLIVAILISRYGGEFSVTHYVSHSANLMVREIGIVLFLASVGLGAGEKFVETLLEGDGVIWMLYGVVITLAPIIIITLVGRLFYKLNYFQICGLIAGTQTDPPALAFANETTGSDIPAVTYATVYPLTTFMRIMIGQVLILYFFS